RVLEVVIGGREQALLAVLAQQVVHLEGLPHVQEVVQLLERQDVEAATAIVVAGVLEVVDGLALSGGRPADQDDVLERIAHAASPCPCSLGSIGAAMVPRGSCACPGTRAVRASGSGSA